MKKFKLIKEYPGSPEVNTEVIEKNHIPRFYYFHDKENRKSYFKDWIENNPEYWEEILEVNFMVSLTDMPFHNAWEPIKVDTIKLDTDTKKYFSTKEGARDFIIQYKPCLNFNEIKGLVGNNFLGSISYEKLFKLVKSKI